MRILPSAIVLMLLAALAMPVRSQSPAAATFDLNGDGHTDLLWQDSNEGWVAAWLMNGTTMLDSVLISASPPASIPGAIYRARATGDLAGDGFADIVFEASDSHQLVAWLMDGGGVAGWVPSFPGEVTNLNYLRTAGDMDGDGSTDFVFWFNPIGAVGVRRSGQTEVEWILEPGTPYTQTVVDRNWQVVGSGDFNGDGRRDVLWYHNAGWVAVWLMDGLRLVESRMVVPFQIQPEWRVAGAGDFNGDGRPDILWQSFSTGRVAVWLMDNLTLLDSLLVDSPNIPPNWLVVGPR